MVDERRDTVILEKGRSNSPSRWIIGLVIVVILLALFFSYGGFGLFNGGTTNTSNPAGGSVNIDTPDSVNVQPSTGQ